MPTIGLLALTLLPLPVSRAGDEAALARGLATISVEEIRPDVFHVASDAMAGRDTPSPGLEATARFVEGRLRELGVAPGARDGYFHRWWRSWRQLDPGQSSLLTRDGRERVELAFGRDYYIASPREMADLDAVGPAVSVGEGSAAEVARAALGGAWAVARPRRGSLRRLASRVRKAGAVGLVVLPDAGDEPPAQRYGKTARYLLEGRFGEPVADVFPTVLLGVEAGARVLREVGRGDLPAAGEWLGLEVAERRRLTHPGGYRLLENVAGLWRGSDPQLAGEVIVVSAHYDHVGRRGGEIYNGADDNGSGTCGLLALAEALTEYGPMRRSVLLLWVSGEEKGLWGSEAWTKRPWLPPGLRPIADLNIDMIGRNDPDYLTITPTRALKHYNQLVELAEELGPLEGFPSLASADAYWRRSDHVNFAVNLNLPVAFLFSDVHEDYHRPTDDPEKIDYDKIRRVVRLVLRMLDGLQADELELQEAPDLGSFQVVVRRGMVLDDLERLGAAARAWAGAHGGRWPQDATDLVGGVLVGEELPLDPWGREYGWLPPDFGEPGRWICYGSDGVPGGKGEGEDVVVER